MCRLSGYYLTKKTARASNKAKLNITDLLVAQEWGGTNATGIGFIKDKKSITVHKMARSASEFVADPSTMELLDKSNPRIMIGHCRATTLGHESNNQNNHPHFTKSGIITIHNGVIWNHDELFKKYRLVRDAEVDSEIIGKMIEMHLELGVNTIQAIQMSLKEIRGSIALALLNAHEPDTLYLVRRENNLSVALDSDTGIVYFATEKQALIDVLFEYRKIMGLFKIPQNKNKITIQEVPILSGLKIKKDHIESFIVEPAPVPVQSGSSYSYGSQGERSLSGSIWCLEHNCWSSAASCKHFSKEEVLKSNYELSLKREKRLNAKDDKQLSLKTPKTKYPTGRRLDFEPSERIKKPSRYSTLELGLRSAHIIATHGETPADLRTKSELERIKQTLTNRPKTVPTQEDRQQLLNENDY